VVEKERFSFGKVPVSIGKMSCDTKGHLKTNLHVERKHAIRGKTPHIYQKVAQRIPEQATVGQTGPKVADIAALLAQHQGAQGEEPPSKKRHRESWGNDCVVDYVTEEKKSPINGSRKKEENEDRNTAGNAPVLAEAITQSRQSLWVF
jgi:hypothetical protein